MSKVMRVEHAIALAGACGEAIHESWSSRWRMLAETVETLRDEADDTLVRLSCEDILCAMRTLAPNHLEENHETEKQ